MLETGKRRIANGKSDSLNSSSMHRDYLWRKKVIKTR